MLLQIEKIGVQFHGKRSFCGRPVTGSKRLKMKQLLANNDPVKVHEKLRFDNLETILKFGDNTAALSLGN